LPNLCLLKTLLASSAVRLLPALLVVQLECHKKCCFFPVRERSVMLWCVSCTQRQVPCHLGRKSAPSKLVWATLASSRTATAVQAMDIPKYAIAATYCSCLFCFIVISLSRGGCYSSSSFLGRSSPARTSAAATCFFSQRLDLCCLSDVCTASWRPVRPNAT
jgi:hypothetical protein